MSLAAHATDDVHGLPPPAGAMAAALANADIDTVLTEIAVAARRRAWYLAPSGELQARAAPSGTAVSVAGGAPMLAAAADSVSAIGSGGAFHHVIDGEPARVLALTQWGIHHGFLALALLPAVSGVGATAGGDRGGDPVAQVDRLLAACAVPVVVQRSCIAAAESAIDDLGSWLIHELQRNGTTLSASTEAVARRLGVDLAQPFAAAVLSADLARGHRWSAVARWLGRPAAIIDDRLLTVVMGDPVADLAAVAGDLERALGDVAVLAALGPTVHEPSSAPRSFKHAELVHELASHDPRARRVSRHDLGMAGVLLDLPTWQLRAFVDRTLAPLSERADLLETVRVWLAERGNRGAAAARMHLHRNSLTQRLHRAASLLGVDFAEPDVWTDLWCALEADRVLRARDRLGHG